MKKWFVPSLLALALCLCLLPTNAAADTPDFNDGTWTKIDQNYFNTASNYKLSAGKYYLDKDVTITQTITTAGADQQTSTVYITLDLNGHTLTQTGKTASVISPSGYVVLTIQDSSAGKTGTITSAATADNCPDVGGIYLDANAIVNLTGGIIEGCVGKQAGAVHVEDGGTFTMSGGTITGCHGVGGTGSDYYPGGVYVDGGGSTFTMTGGTIEKCFSNDTAGGANLVVKSGENATYTAPSATGLTRPSGNEGTYFRWLGSDGKLYDPADPSSNTVPATVTTLTAQWVETFTVTYTDGKDGAIFADKSYSAQDGTNTPAFTGTDLDNVPSWTFTDWLPSVATTVTDNVTYTAQWETKNANTLVLNGNGGKKGGQTVHTQQTNSTTSTISEGKDYYANGFTRPGYSFSFWTAQPDGSGKKYGFRNATEVTFQYPHNGETITLYAQWSLIHNGIFYHLNGGTNPDNVVTSYTVKDETITLPTPTRTNYTFVGWYEKADFTGNAVTTIPKGSTGAKSLYAKWTPVPYTITYNGMDGATNTNPATYTIESDTFTLAAPTREGHAFLGWTGTDLTETTKTVTIEKGSTGERVYTAKWKQLYTVTFDPNGGTLAEAERTAQTDISDRLTLAALPVPTRGGYRFSGWYTAASGGEKVDLEKVYDGNTTLYAHWTRKSTTGGGTATPEPVPDATGGTATPEPVPDATGGTVTAPEADNGGVSVSDKNAAAGETVTVVVTPDAGYALGEITVVDKNGNEVDLVKQDDGSYDFVMPSGGVTVKTDFVPDTGFTDVPAGKYFTAPVAWAVEKGITGGTDAAHFSPYAVCTRGQLVTFLWRAAGRPEAATAANPFTDVRESSSFYPAILWAAENGIVGGYDDGTFRPDAPVTRQQVAAILYRYAKFAGMDTTQGGMLLREFSDYESVSAYALSAMGWAVNTGVLTGNSGALLPHDPCTRAQIVTMLYRLLKK